MRPLRTALPLAVATVTVLAGCTSPAASSGSPTTSSTTTSPMAEPSTTAPSTGAALPDPTPSQQAPVASAEEDEASVLAAGRARSQAMIDQDTARLDELLADDFVAVHITGYEQPKTEWLEQVRDGSMAYHEVQEVSASVAIEGDTAVLTTRNLVTATINGSNGTWPLESTTEYTLRGGVWTATRSRSTTY